ncbi:TlyA family RNA methyltransferase [Dialister sp.]|uniref:TlyA family RNA methyltransferase n=1 Tax=Dialister sp. TaxID=1955814 RepID=UPI003F0B1C60
MANQKVKKERLDVLLVEQGFFESRENAKRHIMEGIILVNDVPVDKAGTKVPVDARLRIKGHVMPYVGRGGYKLEKALKVFSIDLKDKVMADIGASTGGFTDCALQNGASRVYAIDVGTNQLDWKLRSNPQVINMEKTNIKVVTKDLLGEMVDFISTDVSFISVTKIIPAVHSILKADGSLVILIKPQFEAGREKVGKGGIVKDPKVHTEVISDTLETFAEEHFYCYGLTYSPIKGGSGNIEFLAWLKQDMPDREITLDDIEKVVDEAHTGLKG